MSYRSSHTPKRNAADHAGLQSDIIKDDTPHDMRFDFPLTVKVRLDNSWKSVKATQGSIAITARLTMYEGACCALAEVVPDRGTVVFEK